MTYYCPTCDERRHKSETTAQSLDCDNGFPDTEVRVCDECLDKVEELDPFEGYTLEEFFG